MRRNMFGTHELARVSVNKQTTNETKLDTALSLLMEIKDELHNVSFHNRMDSVDVSLYFPLNSAEDLKKFMRREDEEWPLRKRGFYQLLYSTLTKKKRKFGSALLRTLFTRSFIANHKWPYPGYSIVNNFSKNNFIYTLILFQYWMTSFPFF